MSILTEEPRPMLSAKDVKDIPIFAGLGDGELKQLISIAQIQSHQPLELVLEEDRTSRRLWVLLEGQCEVIKRNDGGNESVVIATLGPKSNFGEMSFFHAAPHSASVRAITPVRLMSIERSKFDDLVAREPSLAYKLTMNTIASLADRMRRMSDWVTELLTDKSAPKPVSDLSKLRDQLFNGWQL